MNEDINHNLNKSAQLSADFYFNELIAMGQNSEANIKPDIHNASIIKEFPKKIQNKTGDSFEANNLDADWEEAKSQVHLAQVSYCEPKSDDKKLFKEIQLTEEEKKTAKINTNLLKTVFLTSLYFPKQDLNPQKILSNIEKNQKAFEEGTGIRHIFLKLILASFYFALDNKDKLDGLLQEIGDLLSQRGQSKHNPDCLRVFYLMKANRLLEKDGSLGEVRELLKKAWALPQKYFVDSKEDFLDFYCEIMGRTFFKEEKFVDAENYLLDAQAIRKQRSHCRLSGLSHCRLIGLSHCHLAELYLAWSAKEPAKTQEAIENLKLAKQEFEKFHAGIEKACHDRFNSLSNTRLFKLCLNQAAEEQEASTNLESANEKLDSIEDIWDVGMVNYKIPDLKELEGKINNMGNSKVLD